MAKRTLAELEDELKAKNRRIEDLHHEIDEQRDLISRLREHAEDYGNVMEQWKEVFEMTQDGDDGKWVWGAWWDKHNDLVDRWNRLLRDWNRYAASTWKRNVGRPLAASEAQVKQVHKLHKTGHSLRGIADETSLSFATVRTIVSQSNGTDRTTVKHYGRIVQDPHELAQWKRQRRTGNELPRRIQAVIERGNKLIKEAKGLGKA